ncbi:MAG: thioredoxin [Planctomycetota bacterium]
MAAEYSKDTFETEVLKSEQPVMVDFWSDGCPPCKRLAPVIDALAESNDSAKVGKVNVGQHMELAMEYGITAVPTILVFKGGEIVERMQGYRDQDELQKVIDSHAASA